MTHSGTLIAVSLGGAVYERVRRMATLRSHQRELCRFQKWFTVLTNPTAQIRIPG